MNIFEAKNYELNYTLGILTVTKAPLKIIAADADKSYGDENPKFSYVCSGFKNGESESSLTTKPTLSTTASKGSDVGSYYIVPQGAVSNNYDFTYQNGTLKINQALLNVSVNNCRREYGDENPKFSYAYSGFKNNEDETVLITSPVLSCSADKKSNVGDFDIVSSGGSAKNYKLVHSKGTLSITKAPLTIKANDTTREYGDKNPVLTCTYSGFKNNETENVLERKPDLSTTANSDSPIGKYEIIASGASSKNYQMNYKIGYLNITKASQYIIWNQEKRELTAMAESLELTAQSSKNLPIQYKSSNENIAYIYHWHEDFFLNGISQGTVTVTAIQEGTESCNAAEPVSITFQVIDPAGIAGITDAEQYEVYTLSGMRIGAYSKDEFQKIKQQLTRGIYIVNGKKVVIR